MQYDSALICKNGHLITSYLQKHPENNVSFCPECSAPTISQCPHCHKEIRGHSIGDYSYMENYKIPFYCIHCGKPFPWTESALTAATQIIQEETLLSEQEQNSLIEILPDIITETPKTNLAITRIKKFLVSAGKFSADAMRQFAIDFGCDLFKNSLGL